MTLILHNNYLETFNIVLKTAHRIVKSSLYQIKRAHVNQPLRENLARYIEHYELKFLFPTLHIKFSFCRTWRIKIDSI